MHDFALLGPLTLVLTVYFIHRFRAPAEHLGLVDEPGGRKHHSESTPLVGGVGIFLAFTVGALLLDAPLHPYRPLFAGMGLLLITGVLDDLHDLGAREKMLVQGLAGLVLTLWGGLIIETLGILPVFGPVDLGWLALPFTLLCVVGLINAVNMLDGLDGLAGGSVLVMLCWLIVAGAIDGAAPELPVLLVCGVVGFLLFNLPHRWRREASVFLGDSGSTMLGFALAWFAIELAFGEALGVPPVTVAWILALPIFDTVALMGRRLIKGQSPMVADREHLHHVFLRAGFAESTTTYITMAGTFLLGGIGILGWQLGAPPWAMWLPLLALFLGHCLFVHYAGRAIRLLRRARTGDAAGGGEAER